VPSLVKVSPALLEKLKMLMFTDGGTDRQMANREAKEKQNCRIFV
jgi:hypothetical protein